mgnify:CR=1 FL=1
MNLNTTVTFSLSINLNGCRQSESFTLEELGFDSEYDTNVEKFLQEAYEDWRSNYLDGGWSLKEGESHDN